MSIANDNLYRYLVEASGAIIGSIETTGPVEVADTINVNGVSKTVSSIKDSSPTKANTTITYNSSSQKKMIILMDRNVLVNHGYRDYTGVVTRQQEGFGTNKRVRVLVV